MALCITSQNINIQVKEPQKKPKKEKNTKKREKPKKLILNFHPRNGRRWSFWHKMRWEYNGWNPHEFMNFYFLTPSISKSVDNEIKLVRRKIEENKALEKILIKLKEANKEKKIYKAKKYDRNREYSDLYTFKPSDIEDAMLKIMCKE